LGALRGQEKEKFRAIEGITLTAERDLEKLEQTRKKRASSTLMSRAGKGLIPRVSGEMGLKIGSVGVRKKTKFWV